MIRLWSASPWPKAQIISEMVWITQLNAVLIAASRHATAPSCSGASSIDQLQWGRQRFQEANLSLHYACDDRQFGFDFRSSRLRKATSFTKPSLKCKGVLYQYLLMLNAERTFLTYQAAQKQKIKTGLGVLLHTFTRIVDLGWAFLSSLIVTHLKSLHSLNLFVVVVVYSLSLTISHTVI